MAGRRSISCVLAIAAVCLLSLPNRAAAQNATTNWWTVYPFNYPDLGTANATSLQDYLALFPPAMEPRNGSLVLVFNLSAPVANCEVFNNVDAPTLLRILLSSLPWISVFNAENSNTTQFTCTNGIMTATMQWFTGGPPSFGNLELATLLGFDAQKLMPAVVAKAFNIATPVAITVDWKQSWWQDLNNATLSETLAGIDGFLRPVNAVSVVPVTLSFSTNNCAVVKEKFGTAVGFQAVSRALLATAIDNDESVVKFMDATCVGTKANVIVGWYITKGINASIVRKLEDDLHRSEVESLSSQAKLILVHYLDANAFPFIPGTMNVSVSNATDIPIPAATATIPFSMNLDVQNTSLVNNTQFQSGLKQELAKFFGVTVNQVNLTITVVPTATSKRKLFGGADGILAVQGTITDAPVTTTTADLQTQAATFTLPTAFKDLFGVNAQSALQATITPGASPSPYSSPSPTLAGTHTATSLLGTAVTAAVALLALLA